MQKQIGGGGVGSESKPFCCGSGNSYCFPPQCVRTRKWKQAEMENASQLSVAGKPLEGIFPTLCGDAFPSYALSIPPVFCNFSYSRIGKA